MKKILFILVGVILVLVVCNPIQKVANLDRTKESFEVNKKAKTIRHKKDIYYYEIEDNTIRIIYPNEGVYWWTDIGMSGYGGWNEQYSDEEYIKGSILIDVIKKAKTPIPLDKIGITGGLICMGILNLFWPETVWQLQRVHGHRRREPLMLDLGVIRVSGIIAVACAIGMWT